MTGTLSIARKELKAYFGSPMAAIFIGAFLVAALFSFFWLETFFARNIADIRPLFRWMPLLMIFLTAALTMRQWSEEQRMGTLEVLLTLPVKTSRLVAGKFLAVLTLVAVALALTLGLPVTVSMLGNIDWGPVFGGYLGTLLIAAAYIAIGLFISSRTDNQIIALIVTVLLCGVLYLVGSSGITAFMGNAAGEFFRSFGTGSRFQSIERGVIDLRDVVYYCSITVFFLLLNVVSLDSKRWSTGSATAARRRNTVVAAALAAANLIALNVWLHPVHAFRLDLTENHEYSISQPTRDLITNLEEPLILRGYFSEKTHPLLAPLVPRIRDLMKEYGVVSGGKVIVSFVDPKYDEQLEAEANQQYGIKPVPFQVAGRYEASVVNSYFNILVKYGDQFVTLGFKDLIEIQQRKDGQLDVGLRNLEYDLTKSIKKVVYGFQGLTNIFENINKKLTLTLVVTPETLPAPLAELPEQIEEVAGKLVDESKGKLAFQVIEPGGPDAAVSRDEVNRLYGIEPIAVSLLSDKTFYLHLLLTIDDNTERIFLTDDMGAAEIRQEIEAALKRASSGFLKTVGIWVPDIKPPRMPMMQPQGQQFEILKQVLRENYNVEEADLSSGRAAGDIDVLLLLSTQNMTAIERLAIDQYLMRGGSVVAAAGNYQLDMAPGAQTLQVKQVKGGITDLLSHYGVTVTDALVMDLQNEPFPVPVARDIGGYIVQEIKRLDYPFFVDVRKEGMDQNSPIVANLPAVTMNWTSPLSMDPAKKEKLETDILLRSSPNAWLNTDLDIQPNFDRFPQAGFAVPDERESFPLAASLKGSFTSYFAGKPDPRLRQQAPAADKDEDQPDGITEEALGPKAPSKAKPEKQLEAETEGQPAPITPLIKKSPDSARLVVLGSSEFISDTVISISQSMGQERFLNSLEFIQNIIDWSVEEEDLLLIRSRGSHARLLYPLTRREQSFWEFLNYGIALFALVLLSWYGARRRRHEVPMQLL